MSNDKQAVSTDRELAQQAAVTATEKTDVAIWEANRAKTEADRAATARTVSENIQTDLTQKYDQVVADTATVLAAKTEAVNSAVSAASDAQATAADRAAVSSDKQAVATDKELAQQAAVTATEKTDVAIWEANRAKTEADRAVAATDGKQDKNDLLTAISGVNTAANQIIYTTGVNQVSTISLTNVGKSLISAENAAAALSSLGISDVITESNSVFLKNGRVYKNNGTAQWGWDFFGANGEGMVWSSTASEAMG
ncbi:hypothetical protein KV701_20475, partial [Limnobaculum sp. M2-1]|uniref:hypothetical protein n=1 Tax=Limnobaculum sp. M2-1 TaxID=2855838 RepID=UPI001C44324A